MEENKKNENETVLAEEECKEAARSWLANYIRSVQEAMKKPGDKQ